MRRIINLLLVMMLGVLLFLSQKYFWLILFIETHFNVKNYSAFAISLIVVLSAYCLVIYMLYRNNRLYIKGKKRVSFIIVLVLISAVGMHQCNFISALHKCSPQITIYADVSNPNIFITVDREEIPVHVVAFGVKGEWLEIQSKNKDNDWGGSVKEFIKQHDLEDFYIERKKLRSYEYIIG